MDGRQFRKLLNNEETFGPELLDFEYLLIDVARYTEEQLLSLSNTIGSVFLLHQTEVQAQTGVCPEREGDVFVMGLEKILNDIERKGIREGEQKAKEEVAKRMIDLGLDASVIAAATGFSPDKIDKLREKSH
ncbi:hypothetical protein ACE3MS_29855 [Paenibacillus dendritiformis]|uniref:hypothetical protein n=1 Tax=Paenibacillus dendritiformis TaxID=130049 RepID=UPI003652E60D